MEENEVQIIPVFNEEPEAKIKSLGEIESNINDLKIEALNMKEFYSKIIFNEDTIKTAKDTKQLINKFKTKVSDYRKNITAEFRKPIELFENTAKETESILKDIYENINIQCQKYDEKQKELLAKEIKEYFYEYAKSKNVLVTYEQANIKVNLTSSKKGLKEESKSFIDRIVTDLELINTQQYKEEILVEYNQTLDVSKAITTVNNRMKAIEEQKKKLAEIEQKRQLETENINDTVEKQEILQAPKIENIEKPVVDEIIDFPFRAVGPKSKVKAVFEYAQSLGVKLIKIKEEK